MKSYHGHFDRALTDPYVTVKDGEDVRRLDPRFDLRNHSPDGFSWGYHGSGPSQLALAILVDHFGPGYEARAFPLYLAFKSRVIAAFPIGQEWTLTADQVQAKVDELEDEAP